jgi:hypothetical protein
MAQTVYSDSSIGWTGLDVYTFSVKKRIDTIRSLRMHRHAPEIKGISDYSQRSIAARAENVRPVACKSNFYGKLFGFVNAIRIAIANKSLAYGLVQRTPLPSYE